MFRIHSNQINGCFGFMATMFVIYFKAGRPSHLTKSDHFFIFIFLKCLVLKQNRFPNPLENDHFQLSKPVIFFGKVDN